MTDFTDQDLSILLTDLHFDRESTDRSDPSAVADVIRHQLYQLHVGRALLPDTYTASSFDFEATRLWSDYSAVVDNHDGTASSETNLNNFAGLAAENSSGQSKVKQWKSSGDPNDSGTDA